MLESGGDPNAINAREDAVGLLQIRPILVEDVNRIITLEKSGDILFELEDRISPALSRTMCLIYLNYYMTKGEDRSSVLSSQIPVVEKLVFLGRIWNGGPMGYSKESTLTYARKIRTLYGEIKDVLKVCQTKNVVDGHDNRGVRVDTSLYSYLDLWLHVHEAEHRDRRGNHEE